MCKCVQRNMQETGVFLSSFPGSQSLGALEVLHPRKGNTIYEQKSPLWEASVSRRSNDSRIKKRRCEVRSKELILERREVSKDG